MKYTIQLYNSDLYSWDDIAKVQNREAAKLLVELLSTRYESAYIRVNIEDVVYTIGVTL